LIVPIQCEYYALEGLGQLLRNVNLVQQNINPELRLSGIVMTMFDPRTKLSEQVVEEVQRFFGELVYDVIIPRTVRLSEAPGFGQPITVYDPKSKGAECYRELAREVAVRPPPDSPMPTFDDLPAVVMAPMGADTATPAPIDDATLEEIPMVHEIVEEAPREVTPDRLAEVVGRVLETVDPTAAEPVTVEPPPVEEDVFETEPEAAIDAPADDVGEEIWDDAREAPPRVRPVSAPARPRTSPERRVVVIDEDADIDIRAAQEPLVQIPQRGSPVAPEEPPEIGATLRDDDPNAKRRWRLFRKGGE
jgi:hypothetical protein